MTDQIILFCEMSKEFDKTLSKIQELESAISKKELIIKQKDLVIVTLVEKIQELEEKLKGNK